jgi:hypothetical protein
MPQYTFRFKGGVTTSRPGVAIKFLLFMLNGKSEISFYQARKMQLANAVEIDFNNVSGRIRLDRNDSYTTNCGIAKIFLYEKAMGQKQILQSFYLAFGNETDCRQEVTIRPLDSFAVAAGFIFQARAKFLKRSEVSSILDENSMSAKMLYAQETLPVEILRKFITIKRFEAPKEREYVAHGGARFLRI